jgi:hypothetical protein
MRACGLSFEAATGRAPGRLARAAQAAASSRPGNEQRHRVPGSRPVGARAQPNGRRRARPGAETQSGAPRSNRGWCVLCALTCLAVLVGQGPAPAQTNSSSAGARAATAGAAATNKAGIEIGEIAWSHGELLRAQPPRKDVWKPVTAGEKVRTGDTLRTTENAVTTIALPWMEVSLGPASMLTIPATAVLSTVLEQGRAEFTGAGRDIVKILVGQAEVRGGGRLVLRHASGQTAASAHRGAFRLRAAGRLVEIRAGQGSQVRPGSPPSPPSPLPSPPTGLRPGAEVAYVRSGRAVELRWAAAPGAYHVEVLPLERERVLLGAEARAQSIQVTPPWLGTYRWRVFSRDAQGFESPASVEGVFSVVER